MDTSSPQPVFLNLEFIFSWLYQHVGSVIAGIFTIQFFELLRFIATILVILLITLIIYLLVRFYELKKEDEKKKQAAKPASSVIVGGASTPTTPSFDNPHNPIWDGIRTKLLSDSPSDWRLAIIEADIYLDKTLDAKGYPGDTLGDKLKNITPDQLGSIQIAWEAHKVRNRIAHDGAAFTLTQPESRRVLSYFEIVFRDLGVI